jgi:hypothetical protein
MCAQLQPHRAIVGRRPGARYWLRQWWQDVIGRGGDGARYKPIAYAYNPESSNYKMAERGGFEPPVRLLTVQRFSKPPPSATRPSLRSLAQKSEGAYAIVPYRPALTS